MNLIQERVVAGLQSDLSKRAYAAVYRDFSGNPLTLFGVNEFLESYRSEGAAPATINLKLSALKAWVKCDRTIPAEERESILALRGVSLRGARMGTWLSIEQVASLLLVPGEGLAACRNRAIMAALVGSAVRRSEFASLTMEHMRSINGRLCFVDFIGKGQKLRTVPLPAWAEKPLTEWVAAAGIKEGPLWRRVYWGKVMTESIGADHIHTLVKQQGLRIGVPKLAPHDLRRTFAQLSRSGAAPLEQIQQTLGHSSLLTTQRYLGGSIALGRGEAACDAIRI